MTSDSWQNRVDALWTRADEIGPEALVAEMRALVEERAGDPVAAFELAGAFDSTGATEQAVPLYRDALERGLDSSRHRQASIQLASSLRALGSVEEPVHILEEEMGRVSDELDDAVRAFLALALASGGRAREATALLLTGLVPRLPRYQRSVAAYAEMLRQEQD